MPRSVRLVVPGYPHHVTQRGVRRQATFLDDYDYKSYLRLAAELSPALGIQFWAYCLMPNHIHAVVIPEEEGSLAKFFKVLHQRYARLTNLKYEWEGHMWQARYYSVPMNEVHTLTALRYVELNPVRGRLVGSPEEWPWSSARANLGLQGDSLIDRNETRHIVPNWADYLSAGESSEDLRIIRRQTATGKPDDDPTR